jgi:hypothetical protein
MSMYDLSGEWVSYQTYFLFKEFKSSHEFELKFLSFAKLKST